MKGIWDLFAGGLGKTNANKTETDSTFFGAAFASQGADAALLTGWDARAAEIGAKRLSRRLGGKRLRALWRNDPAMAHLDIDAMESFFEFCAIPPGRDVIRQGEYGNFMVLLLAGAIAVDRVQPWGEHLRLAETRPGDILGEMSLLDSGVRFSACTTLTDCEAGVLSAQAMDKMMTEAPRLAAGLVALLARKLSHRLRVVSARLSEHPH